MQPIAHLVHNVRYSNMFRTLLTWLAFQHPPGRMDMNPKFFSMRMKKPTGSINVDFDVFCRSEGQLPHHVQLSFPQRLDIIVVAH